MPNTDPAHEKAESPEREAEEQNLKTQGAGGASTAPSASSSQQ